MGPEGVLVDIVARARLVPITSFSLMRLPTSTRWQKVHQNLNY